MNDSVLDGKRILAVDDEPAVLRALKNEITAACPTCTVEGASCYEGAVQLLETKTYDAVILDIMLNGFDLLDMAVDRGLKVAMLTPHLMSAEELSYSIQKKARSYLSKAKLNEIVTHLEDLLKLDYESAWLKVMERLQQS